MAERADLPLSLRASANRRARPRRPPSQRLRDAAAAGLITRGNTRRGTAGRQAADAEAYRRRLATRPGRTARERAGHEAHGAPERVMLALLDGPPRWAELHGLSRGEARRVARYDSLLGHLAAGDISGAAFRRRVSSWAAIRGERFLADPDLALALLSERAEGGESLFRYEGRRT